MSMSKKNEKREIKQDQLLPEWSFLHFCNEDRANSYVGGGMEISEQFLRAAEKDNLIKPILQVQGKIRQNDGTEKEGLVNHYSPHQIYLLAELRHNILDEDGNLRAPNTIDWYKERPKEQRPRYIEWGRGHSFWADNPKKRDEDEDNLWVGAHLLSEYLHNFLGLLHSFEQPKKEHYYYSEEKRRYWSNAPILEYDFKPLKSGNKKLLKIYGLDERKLNILRMSIGQFAEMTDPLAHWYYYIKRHPEWKKDLLKGDASLAQEIYHLYDLLTEVWEITTKNKAEPIFEFLYKDFGTPLYAPKTEYLHGEDTMAMKYTIQQFKKWKRKQDNKPFVSDKVLKKIAFVEKELNDYEKRYGDRSYAGNIRWAREEDNIKLEDLDEKTKWYVDNTFAQIKDAKVKEEIPRAIEHRLGDLQQELRQIFWDISEQFRDKENAAWQKINGNNLWMELSRERKFENLDRVQQIELANKERKKIEKEAKDWKEKSKDFHQTVSWFEDLAFCKVCRKKPVRLHIEDTSRNMWQVSLSVICDDCFANINQNSLTANDEWWKQTTQAEWKCDCIKKNYKGEPTNPMLYKFAYGNMATLKTQAGVPIKFTTLYGRAILEAKCPNCGKLNKRFIDWGWLP